MTGHDIRAAFLKFFAEKGHKVVPSASLVPHDDPSVLLTTAGMQQFKPYFLGEPSPYGNRVASVQKSFRTSDIDAVGDDTHNTFFEMLGNFSFNYPQGEGSYFKEEAIKMGLEFVRDILKIDRKRLTASVFGGDEEVPLDKESIAIWKKLGFGENEIKKGTREENFWGPTGGEGPCGPTAEIYIDGVETWNLVFNEYYSDQNRKLTKLKAQGVDTGLGLERIASVVQKTGLYGTDLFSPIIITIAKALPGLHERAVRIITDHLRASVFLIADGVTPSNKEQGYVLRRLLRRSLALAQRAGGSPEWFLPVAEKVIEEFSSVYPELSQKADHIFETIKHETQLFGQTLQRGLKEFEHLQADQKISGAEAFRLYETFGFPIELTEELAAGRDVKVDREAFEQARAAHQEKSRAGAAAKFGGHGLLSPAGEIIGGSDEDKKKILRLHTATHLLHQALRDVLGEGVRQMGSDINAERLRFDFAFDRKMETRELKRIEEIVNDKVKENLPVFRQEMSREEAEKTGALAFFKQKYGEQVSVYFVGSREPAKAYSKEFCGGPHVQATGEIGSFKILKEEAVGAGVRRIKATVA